MYTRIGLTILLAFVLSTTSNSQTVLSISEIVSTVNKELAATNEPFDFDQASSRFIHSMLVQTDSIAVIGFQPADMVNLRPKMHLQDFSSTEWRQAKQNIINRIQAKYQEQNGEQQETDDLIPINEILPTPFFFVKLHDLELIEELREMKEVRYVEPSNTDLDAILFRSGEGCSDNNGPLNPNDYTPISPMSAQSWHHLDHKVHTAWPKGDQGKDIWIAVMDSGISEDNPKYNGEFAEGESAGRVIEKKGFYQNDGWVDRCGHGTSMAGAAVAPRGFDDTPAGVAYRSNLITYRVTNDVIINSGDEINGLGSALFDVGADSRIHIVSISLGDVFSHSPVEDGIIDAEGNGKLIFCAAGTSTSFTNFVGVIFPASMDETVAVTGVVEGTDFSECSNCHFGSKVDFSIYMERSANDNGVPTTSKDTSNAYTTYTAGSSVATATMAGIAALTWDNYPNLNKNQILNRLIQTSSRYPARDDDFGWGAPDACAAVDVTANLPCASSIGNNVVMEIYEITFPPTSDGFFDNTAEWVVKINSNNSYYFEVPTSGATGNPTSFNNATVCDIAPIILDLGNSSCGQASISINLETHEDDGAASDCDFNFGDDDQTITNPPVQFGSNSFTQNTPNGTFTFHYNLYCTPLLIASLTDSSPVCYGESLSITASPSNAANYHFYHDANANNVVDPGETLQNGPSSNITTNTLNANSLIRVIITDNSNCTDTASITPFIVPANYQGANMIVGIETGIADYETDGVIESTQLIGSAARVDYDSATEINLLPGFETQLGAEFEAFIDGCDLGGGGLNFKVREVTADEKHN